MLNCVAQILRLLAVNIIIDLDHGSVFNLCWYFCRICSYFDIAFIVLIRFQGFIPSDCIRLQDLYCHRFCECIFDFAVYNMLNCVAQILRLIFIYLKMCCVRCRHIQAANFVR